MKTIIITITALTALFFTSCREVTKQEDRNLQTPKEFDSKIENNSQLLIGSWVEPNPINKNEVQGFTLKNDGSAVSINMATLQYKLWWNEEGKLTLVSESIGNRTSSIDTIVYEIVKNTDSVLEIKNGDYILKYTRQ